MNASSEGDAPLAGSWNVGTTTGGADGRFVGQATSVEGCLVANARGEITKGPVGSGERYTVSRGWNDRNKSGGTCQPGDLASLMEVPELLRLTKLDCCHKVCSGPRATAVVECSCSTN